MSRNRTSPPPKNPPRRRPRSFDRLEDRRLLSAGPVVATADQLAGAVPLSVGVETGSLAAGGSAFYQIAPSADSLLVARLQDPGSVARLSILDGSGRLIVQNDGISASNPDNELALHLGAGPTYYLEVAILQGGGGYSLTTQLGDANRPGQPAPAGVTAQQGALAVGDFLGDGGQDVAVGGVGYAGGQVEIFPSLGDGTFGDPIEVDLGTAAAPGPMVAGHFFGGPATDLAVSLAGGGVDLLQNLGGGQFDVVPVPSADGLNAGVLVTGNFGGQGHADLALADTTDYNATGFQVLLNDGHGDFGPATTFAAGYNIGSMVSGRFGPGPTDDLVAAVTDAYGNDYGIESFVDDGSGSFNLGEEVGVGLSIQTVVAGHFTGGSPLDVAGIGYNGIAVFPGAGDGTFGNPVMSTSSFDTSSLTLISSAISADFAGNGLDDLAVGLNYDQGENGVGVLPNLGDGTFGDPAIYSTTETFLSLAAAPFSGSGRLDLAGVNSTGGLVVLPGLGDGSFQAPRSFAASISLSSIASGDFAGDGRADLVTTGPGGVSLFPGLGDGTFGAPSTITTGQGATSVVVGDFNGDGRLDLAIGGDSRAGSGGGIAILFGNGDGTFQAPDFVDPNLDVDNLVAGDFDGNGRLDLAAAGPEGLTILANEGQGNFTVTQTLPADLGIDGMVAGQFRAGGPVNLAVAINFDTGGGVTLLENNGQGQFQAGGPIYQPDGQASSLVAGYFQGPGQPEGLAFIEDTDAVEILPSLGDGTFGNATTYPFSPDQVVPLVAADFSGDGYDDLAAGVFSPTGTGPVLAVLPNDGQGQIEAPNYFGSGLGLDTLVADDFNGDGRPDLAGVDPQLDLVDSFLNAGNGTFSNPGSLAVEPEANPILADPTGSGVDGLLVTDQSGDILWRAGRASEPGTYQPPVVVNPGRPALDVALIPAAQGPLIAGVDRADDFVTLYADGAGGFQPVGSLATGALPAQIVAASIAGGSAEMVIRDAADGSATVYLDDPSGNFIRLPDVPIGLGSSSLALDDFDGSGLPDLVVTNRSTGAIRVYPGLPGGGFGPPSIDQAGRGPYGTTVNPDGSVELSGQEGTAGSASGVFVAGGPPGLATADPGSNTVAVLDGLGGGTVASAQAMDTTTPARVIRAGDLTGDGLDDLAVLGSDGVTIFLANGDGTFTRLPPIPAGPDPTGLTIADVNGDGVPDLLVGDPQGDVLVLLGNGDGSFRPYQKTDRRIALALSESDGQDSFAVADEGQDLVQFPDTASGAVMTSGRDQGVRAPADILLADLNGDGIPDLIVANTGSNNVLVYPGLGDGEYASTPDAFFSGTAPAGITVANLVPGGPPDLVVANEGSNDVSVLIGQGTGAAWTMVPGPRLKVGEGPTATLVMDLNGDGIPDLLVSDGQSNDVRLLRGLGNGFFDDSDPVIYSTGMNPGPLFVADFSGQPGQLDLVTLNAGSNDLSYFADINGGNTTGERIGSGGLTPLAAVLGNFGGPTGVDLLVANDGDGQLALFLGGNGGAPSLGGLYTSPDLPNPTALAVDETTGSIYGATEGVDGAFPITLGTGNSTLIDGPSPFQIEPEGDLSPPALGGGANSQALPEGPGEQQLVFLQSEGESALALAATILSVSVEPSAAMVAALPNQPKSPVDEDQLPVEEEPAGDPEPPPQAASTGSPLFGFLAGLDNSFAQVARSGSILGDRPPASGRVPGPGIAGSTLERWSPMISLCGPAPRMAASLGRLGWSVARSIRDRTPPARSTSDRPAPIEPWSMAAPSVAALVGLAAVARATVGRPVPGRPRGRFR